MSTTEQTSTSETGAKVKSTAVNLEEEVQRQRNLAELITNTKVKDVFPTFRHGIIALPKSTTVEGAFEILSANNILSAPVIDVQQTEILGMVDMFDLVSYVIKKYIDAGTLPPSLDSARWEEIFSGIEELRAKGISFGKEPVVVAMNLSGKDPYCTILEDAPLPLLLRMFQTGLHRAVAIDHHEYPRAVVSQSNVVKFIAKNINYLGKLGSTTIKELDIGSLGAVQVTTEAAAIYGFYLLNELKVSAVAIVDKGGVLLANLSVSDLRGLTSKKLSALFLPVLEYLKEYSPGTKFPPITCTDNDTFEYILLKLVGTKTHRIWRVDGLGKPIGVISLTDIMRVLHQQIEGTC